MKPMSVSQRVVHEQYGLGTITEVGPKYTTIEFDLHGRKKFVTSIVILEPSSAPPPPRRRGGARPKARQA